MSNKNSKPYLLNQTQAAEFLGITRQTLMEKGFTAKKRGRAVFYDSRDLLVWAIDRATKKLKKQIPPMAGVSTIETERLRLTSAQVDAQELKNEIARAEVVPVDFATFTLSRVANEAAGILDSLPLHIKRRHPEAGDKVLQTIRWELSKSMNALAGINETALPGIIDEYLEQMNK